MKRFSACFVWALIWQCIANAPSALSQTAEKPLPQAEVRLGDGSRMRMSILQQHIEVVTKYGKLKIPVADVRRIEFGVHLPDGVAPRIQSAIKDMGSDDHTKRMKACKDLVGLGIFAYSMLHRAADSADLEVAKRSRAVIKQIMQKTPAERLRTKVEDFIQTTTFPVTGRIVSRSIKAHSVHFGELELKLHDLRSIHLRGSTDETTLTITAKKHGSDPKAWLDTGIEVDPSLRMVFTSHGQVDLWPQGPGQYMADPNGYKQAGLNTTHMAGALIGRIGKDGKTFVIGNHYDGIPAEEGRLYLQIVPSPWNNPSTGEYRVRIRTDYVALSK